MLIKRKSISIKYTSSFKPIGDTTTLVSPIFFEKKENLI